MENMIGQTLGPYRIVEMIGGGGMAEVLGNTEEGELRLSDVVRPLSDGLDLVPSDNARAGANTCPTPAIRDGVLTREALEMVS